MKKTFKNLLLVLLLVLGGVTLLACNKSGSVKALAKDEDAYMVQAVSAANMSQAAATMNANPAVTLENKGGINIETNIKAAIESNLADSLVDVIDQQLAMLDTFLQNIEIKHGKSDREGFEKMASYTSQDLEGNTVSYKLYYNVTEHEVEDDGETETEFRGVLVITRGENVKELPIDGEIEIDPEDGEKELTVVHEANGVKVEVKSKVKAGEREFEYCVDPEVGQKLEFKLKIKNQKGKMALEIETKIGKSEVKMKLQVRSQEKDRKQLHVELELDDFDVVVGTLESDLDVEINVDSSGEEVVSTYKFQGKFKFKSKVGGAETESEFDFQHQNRHRKGQTDSTPETPADTTPETTPETPAQ